MENNKRKSKENFYQGLILGGGIVIIVLLAFFFGFKMGRKNYDCRYPPIFHPFIKSPKQGFLPKKFRGHGLIGVVDSVSKESFIVKTRWGELVTVLVDKNTKYKVGGRNGSFFDVKKGKTVIVIGEPQEEEFALKASLVRVF